MEGSESKEKKHRKMAQVVLALVVEVKEKKGLLRQVTWNRRKCSISFI